jgi:hypothetical protein
MNFKCKIIAGLYLTVFVSSAAFAQRNSQPSNFNDVNGATRNGGANTVAGPQPGMPGNYNQNHASNPGSITNGNTTRHYGATPPASQTGAGAVNP